MNKVLLMLAVSSLVVLTSCSKKSDYTCTCNDVSSQNGVSVATTKEVFEYKDSKEEDAEKLCDSNQSTIDASFGGTSVSQVRTCTLE